MSHAMSLAHSMSTMPTRPRQGARRRRGELALRAGLLALSLALNLSGCTSASDQAGTWDESAGIAVMAVSDCHEGAPPEWGARFETDERHVVVSGAMPARRCAGRLERPYLTQTVPHRRMLVVAEQAQDALFRSACDCWRSFTLRVDRGRLDDGDTLYVVADAEVIGHAVIR